MPNIINPKSKMMKNLKMPINRIGESDWIDRLTAFLEEYDIEVLPMEEKELINETEKRLNWKLPDEMKEYYFNFGGSDNMDFMYGLYPLDDFIPLSDSIWEFVQSEFSMEETENYIVFAQSPANDPLCINRDTREIVLFSHDPLRCAKVYNNFNDYLINEIVSVQELLGELEFDEGEKIKFMTNLLPGYNIDYEFRHMKLE